MGFGTIETKTTKPSFVGGTTCSKCSGMLVNVDGGGTPFTFCRNCGRDFCSRCGQPVQKNDMGKFFCSCQKK